MMARAGRQLAVAQCAQLPAERLLGDRDAELLEYPLCEIDKPPAQHTMDRRDWAALDHPDDRLALGIIELGGLPRRLAVQQPVGPASVEAQHPVPDDLKSYSADLRRFGARRTVVDRSKRQQAPSLGPFFVLFANPRSRAASKSPRSNTTMANLHLSPS